jgi:polyhydroxyalkanoate synthesis regulator phasin
MSIVPEINLDSPDDLLKYVKTLPEEARQDFMAVLVSLEDGDITVQEATQYIGDILRQYAPVQ